MTRVPELPVVIIGPMRAGKSTQAALVADALGVPRVSLDTVRWDYYREIGYDADHANRLRADGGFAAIVRYWKPFEAHAVERVLADHPDAVIDFGAGHSVYEDPALLDRARRALAPVSNVVLLLPSADLAECLRVLAERTADVVALLPEGQRDAFRETAASFVTHPSNGLLAKHTLYTEADTPEETCRKIINTLAGSKPS